MGDSHFWQGSGELHLALIRYQVIMFAGDKKGGRGVPDAPGSALSQLDWFLDALLRMTEPHLPLFAVLEEVKPRQEAYQNPFYRALHQRISHLLTKAVAQGETVDLDVTWTADVILAAIMPPLYDFQRQSRNFSRERILAGMRRLFIDGLRVPSQQATDTGGKG